LSLPHVLVYKDNINYSVYLDKDIVKKIIPLKKVIGLE